MDADNVSSSVSPALVSLDGAFESVRDELSSIDESDLVHINIDVMAAVTTALGVLPKVLKLRPRIEGELPKFDLWVIDRFETYVMALYEAQADYLSATRPAEPLPELVEQATKVRDTLFVDVQALVQRHLLDGDEVREVKTAVGYKALAMDLQLLANAMHRKWEVVQSKTAVQLPEILQANQLARRLLRVVGEREQAPAVAAEAAANRSRAFALFLRAYDEVRRAVTYLRWRDGDWDQFTPSLYAGRGAGKRKGEVETPVPTSEPTVKPGLGAGTVPAVTPVVPAAPAAPTHGLPASGLPSSDPFTHA
ncbi:MAG: hypothetical protein RLZZ450_2718 [Pseudomonadota bacterium]